MTKENQVTSLIILSFYDCLWQICHQPRTISPSEPCGRGHVLSADKAGTTKKKSKPWHVHVWTCLIVWWSSSQKSPWIFQESIWSFSHGGCHYRFFSLFRGEDCKERIYLSWIFLSILMGRYVEGVNLTAEEFYQKNGSVYQGVLKLVNQYCWVDWDSKFLEDRGYLMSWASFFRQEFQALIRTSATCWMKVWWLDHLPFGYPYHKLPLGLW